MLSNGTLFKKDEQFNHLEPIYDVSSEDIETYIKSLLAQEWLKTPPACFSETEEQEKDRTKKQ